METALFVVLSPTTVHVGQRVQIPNGISAVVEIIHSGCMAMTGLMVVGENTNNGGITLVTA